MESRELKISCAAGSHAEFISASVRRVSLLGGAVGDKGGRKGGQNPITNNTITDNQTE
jgi:hypothetical protein